MTEQEAIERIARAIQVNLVKVKTEGGLSANMSRTAGKAAWNEMKAIAREDKARPLMARELTSNTNGMRQECLRVQDTVA